MIADRPDHVPGPPGSAHRPPDRQEPDGESRDEGRAARPRADAEQEVAPDSNRAVRSEAPDAAVAAELEDRWRRAVADLDNLRKRHHSQLERVRAAERERVAAAFLPVLDNIDLALRHAGADPATIIEGVRAVREQALAVLAALGYPRHEEEGVPFDPARHEVVGVVPADEVGLPPGAVASVLRPGYGDPDRQLRPASVTVAGSPGG
jgi:molecular chaperone GrpE